MYNLPDVFKSNSHIAFVEREARELSAIGVIVHKQTKFKVADRGFADAIILTLFYFDSYVVEVGI